jgi:hypothetical protein
MTEFVFYVAMVCERCGRHVGPEETVSQKDYENWKIINRRRQKYCRHCRSNVKVTFDPR